MSLLLLLIGISALQAAWAAQASAACPPVPDAVGAFGIAPGCLDGEVSADPGGSPYTQAAGHPYGVSLSVDFNTRPEAKSLFGFPIEIPWPEEPLRTVVVDAPPGLVGNPSGIAKCSLIELAGPLASGGQGPACPVESQVGAALIKNSSLFVPGGILSSYAAVYNLVPGPGVPARFGMNVAGVIVAMDAQLRSGSDYGVSIVSRNTAEGVPIVGLDVSLWGVPADPAHDSERACEGQPDPPCTTTADPVALLTLPTACTAPGEGLVTAMHVDSWFNSAKFNLDGTPDLSDPRWKSDSFESHLPPGYPLDPVDWGPPQGPDGCASVDFSPQITIQPTSARADSPTGLDVNLTIPQDGLTNPSGLAQAHLKRAVVELPEGMTVNASAADGLGACTPAQIDLGTALPPTCPDSSKIGTVEVDTPLLNETVAGSVYVAEQGTNPFGSLLAIYIVAHSDERGITVKLPGRISPDPSTGRLRAIFDDNLQLPFSHLNVRLKGGDRAALINPPACGTYDTTAELSPWSGNAPVDLESSFAVTSGPNGGPCPPNPLPLDPKLSAGVQSPVAGSHSPFALKLTREDGTQRFASLDVSTPQGLVAKLAGIPSCPAETLAGISSALGTGAAQNAAPACPASQVGTVTVGAGAGSSPFYVETGRAYLAGPYKGAPLSLAIVTPALAGPFDLGNVVVRSAVHIDSATAQITVKSDPLPQILHGIPLDLRDVRVRMDRPGFTVAPTSCEPMSVDATVHGAQGATANVSNRFQVGDCAALAFKPRLRLNLRGGTGRGAHPALRAELRMPPGNANIARAAVTLPSSAFLDQSHLKNICTRVNFAAGTCPQGSRYGFARAWSPLLDQTLSGPVYLRSSSNKLPDMVADLRGPAHQPIRVELTGRIDSVKLRGGGSGIRSTFAQVPDVPVSKFVLRMQGGDKGLIQNSTNLCRRKNRAVAKFDGHNGKIRDFRPLVWARCARSR